MRTIQDIENQKNSRRLRSIETGMYAPPLGYIRGFRMTLSENQITIGKGYAEIRGKTANISSDYVLNWEDYITPGVAILKGLTYYIYLESGGKHLIDNLAPLYDDDALAWYHPTLWSYRSIGQFDYGTTGTYSNLIHGDPVEAPSLATNAVTSRTVLAADINTLFLRAAGSIIIGYAGTGTNSAPAEGDRRVYIDDDEIGLEEYAGGAWVTANSIKIGGVIAGLFCAMIGCYGVYNSLNPPTATETLPHPNFRVFSFENNYQDHLGVDDWTSKVKCSFDSGVKKFGSYSIKDDNSNGNAYLVFSTAASIGESQAVGFWVYVTDIVVAVQTLGYLQWDADNYIKFLVASDGAGGWILQLNICQGGSVSSTAFSGITLNAWHYVGGIYNATTDKGVLVLDNNASLSFSCAGTWDTLADAAFALNIAVYSAEYKLRVHVDELLIYPDKYLDPNYLIQHYTHNTAWVTTHSKLDLLLSAGTDGRIFTEDPIVSTDSISATGITCSSTDNTIPMLTIDSAALAVDQVQTLAHGLGVKPNRVHVSLLCVTGEAGYSAGDEVISFSNFYDTINQRRWAVAVDDTNITTMTDAGGIVINRKDNGNAAVITMANWKFRIRYGL